MSRHRITEENVESALLHPEYFEPSREGRFNAWLNISERFLRVTYKEESDHFLIIAAVMKKRGWR
jgi:hypothetical protein